MQTEKDIVDYWFEKRDLSKSTIELYKGALKQYSRLIGKSIFELLDKADKEEENRVRLKKRGYSKYTVDFKRYLMESKNQTRPIDLILIV